MQATVVAFYGEKPEALRALLLACQDAVAGVIGARFRRYEPGQIHGTVIGLECCEEEPHRFLNRNFAIRRQVAVEMDFGGLLGFLREGIDVPFRLQIGGFENRDYPFTSRGTRPFVRGFSLQGDCVVVMGWPFLDSRPAGDAASPAAGIEPASLYPASLERIRRAAQRHGVLHAYHAAPSDTDNDFYLRIGMIDHPDGVDAALATGLQETLRRFLAARPPTVVEVGLADLSIAFYESPELPLGTTRAYSLADRRLDAAFIRETLGRRADTRSAAER